MFQEKIWHTLCIQVGTAWRQTPPLTAVRRHRDARPRVERGDARHDLDGPGHKYLEPVVDGSRVFVSSCDTIGAGPAHLEAWELVTGP